MELGEAGLVRDGGRDAATRKKLPCWNGSLFRVGKTDSESED
jgi:hypothetical protein